MDKFLQLDVWKSTIPCIFTLAPNDTDSLHQPEPLVRMIPRFGFLASIYPSLCSHFDQYAKIPEQPGSNSNSNAENFGISHIWLQAPDGSALKWWYPIGPLFDTLLEKRAYDYIHEDEKLSLQKLKGVSVPLRITVRYSISRPSSIIPIKGEVNPLSYINALTSTPSNQRMQNNLHNHDKGDDVSDTKTMDDLYLHTLKQSICILYESGASILTSTAFDKDGFINAYRKNDPIAWDKCMDQIKQAVDSNLAKEGQRQLDSRNEELAAEQYRQNRIITTTTTSNSPDKVSSPTPTDSTTSTSMLELSSSSVNPTPEEYKDIYDPLKYTPLLTSYYETLYNATRHISNIPIRVSTIGCEEIYFSSQHYHYMSDARAALETFLQKYRPKNEINNTESHENATPSSAPIFSAFLTPDTSGNVDHPSASAHTPHELYRFDKSDDQQIKVPESCWNYKKDHIARLTDMYRMANPGAIPWCLLPEKTKRKTGMRDTMRSSIGKSIDEDSSLSYIAGNISDSEGKHQAKYTPDNGNYTRLRTFGSVLGYLFPNAKIVDVPRQDDCLFHYNLTNLEHADLTTSGNQGDKKEESSTGNNTENIAINILVEGISIPLDTPLVWVYEHFRQIDGYLYITARRVKYVKEVELDTVSSAMSELSELKLKTVSSVNSEV